jgi:predicted secreted Zn-dependent protease
MSNAEVSAEALVSVYIKIRSAIEHKEEEHKVVMQGLKEQLEAVSDQLLTICSTQNAEGIRTSAGTVSRRVSSRYWTSDWDSMYTFIKEHDAPFLLEQRIHNGNMRQFLKDNPDVLPAGLQAERKFTIQVYKPRNK